eukprot:jgi/Tetstr1/460048/TSEL_005368.t1
MGEALRSQLLQGRQLAGVPSRAQPPLPRMRPGTLQAPHRRSAAVSAAKSSAGAFQKAIRVLKEKAVADADRVFKGTSKTRQRLGVLDELFTFWNLDETDDTLEELEDLLITADFGPKTAFKVVDGIRSRIMDGELKTGDDIRSALKKSIKDILDTRGGDPSLQLGDSRPSVILIIGVNGSGKTTTVGKLSHKFGEAGLNVLLAAGDTFRAAAVEQLAEWSNRATATVAEFSEGMKPEEVIAAAVTQAVNDNTTDIVICDTSGRLHNNFSLMEELQRCKKAVEDSCEGAPHEVILVLDGTTGLNMTNQAREFTDAAGVTGIILTKLDGTARGGAVVSVVDELGIPVKFVGVGETADDLQPFDSGAFVEGLFPEE